MIPARKIENESAAASRKRESEFIAAMEASRDAFLIFDSDDVLIYASSWWRETFFPDLDATAQLPITFREMLNLVLDQGAVVVPDGGLETLVSERLANHRGGKGTFEYELKDGRLLEVQERRTPTGGIIIVFSDLTHARRTERALRESEERYRAMFEDMPEGLYRSSPDGRFLEVNPALARMMGCASPAEFLARYQDISRDFYADPGTRNEILRELKTSGRVRGFECAVTANDGQRLWISESVHTVHADDGRPVAYEGCIVDVTERRLTEQKLRERVKELACLYDISDIRWNDGSSLDEIFQAIANRLPGGFQYVEDCCARISYKGRSFVSPGFVETPWSMARDIRMSDSLVGRIEVFYRTAQPEEDDGPFFREERDLLERIAHGLAGSIRYRRTMEAAERGAAMLQHAATLANLGFCIWDEIEDRMVFCSKELADNAALTPEEYCERASSMERVLQLVHPDDREAYRRFARTTGSVPERHEIEYRVVRHDGSVRHWHEISDPVKDAKGRVSQSICTIQDITEFKRRESELRRTKSFLLAQFNSTPLAVTAYDRNGGVMAWNPAAERITGWSAEDVVGKRPPHAAPGHADGFDARLKTLLDRKHEGTLTFRDRLPRKDGSCYDACIHASQLQGDGGETIGVLAVVEDVTEQDKAWRALAASEARFRAVASQLPLAFVVTEAESATVLFANDHCRELFGFGPDDAGRVCALAHYADPSDRVRLRQRISRDGRVNDYELQMRRGDGALFWVSATIEPVEFEGRPALCSTFIDITERKRLRSEVRRHEEQVRQTLKMQALGTLAGGIAHDFNNILLPLIMFTEDAIEQIPECEPAQENLRQVLRGAERARELVQQILAFAREESVSGAPHDIYAVVTDALQLVRRTLPPGLLLETKLESTTGQCRLGPSEITQILMNLAVNADNAMGGEGTLRIELDRERVTETRESDGMTLVPGLYARLSVEDNGPGMSPWVRSRLFEPFFTTKEVGEGTGLGLSVVHGLVRQNHGAIFVDSAPGAGAHFDIFLPLVDIIGENQDATEGTSPALTRH